MKEKTWGNEVRLFTNVTIALWETDDWHGRHFAPARSASIVWEIVNIWHCQTTRTHFYPCEEKRQNSPPVSKKFLNYFLTKNNSHHLVKKIEQINLFFCFNIVFFRWCCEKRKQLPQAEKNGSVLPLPKYLVHFQRRFLPRFFALKYLYFISLWLFFDTLTCLLRFVNALVSTHFLFWWENVKVYIPLVACVLVGSFRSAAIILRYEAELTILVPP